MFRDHYKKLLTQLAIELNCSPSDLCAGEDIITLPALNEGRRSYSPGKPFLQIAMCGVNSVIMADECLHGFLGELIKDTGGYRLFEFEALLRINRELNRHGYQISPTHHMFLPCCNVAAEKNFQVKWLYDTEIAPFYGDPRFPNAIAYPDPCPVRPDRIAVIALDGDNIMGMAGCSEDAPHWYQIGIDVVPQYRSKGVGTYLVTLLKNRIMEMGNIPFYGTAAANVQSQNIAVKSGFRPAWVETEAVLTGPGN